MRRVNRAELEVGWSSTKRVGDRKTRAYIWSRISRGRSRKLVGIGLIGGKDGASSLELRWIGTAQESRLGEAGVLVTGV